MSTQGAFGAFGAFGSFGAFGAFGGTGSFGAFGGAGAFGAFGSNGGYAPDGLIQSRDGIVGAWARPTSVLAQLAQGATPLTRWEAWVRAELVDFDLKSSLHFSADTAGFTLWHAKLAGTAPESATYQPIANLTRPPDLSASSTLWLDQLDIVANWADLRLDRASEILSQLGPPLAYWSMVLNLHPERHRWTLEVLGAALRLANYAEMRFKHALACRRPVEYSPQLQPMILTPGHGSLPSGHATEANIAAYVLWKLVSSADSTKSTEWLEQLMRLAARVAINRTIAGVHFPVDSAAGQLLGLTLGAYFVQRATTGGTYQAWMFDGANFIGTSDFDWRVHFDVSTGQQRVAANHAKVIGSPGAAGQAPLLAELWSLARTEWP